MKDHAMFLRLALPTIAALLLAGPALVAQNAPPAPGAPAPATPAPPALPGQRDISRITAGTYATDPAHTLVGWKVDHLGFNDYFGQFGDVTGTLVLDPANPSRATVDVTIPISGLATASSALTRHMQTADFFDMANHPTARFTSTAVEVTAERVLIAGNLTIRGVTRPIILGTRFVGAGTGPMNRKETIGFHATTIIRRSDFGMTYGVPMVSDAVELTISAAFEKQSS
jgi:polyisoprenoid-binding protein YceI